MHMSNSSVEVSASIDVRGDTRMFCLANGPDGDFEVRLGAEGLAYLFLSAEGAEKLVRTLVEARANNPGRS